MFSAQDPYPRSAASYGPQRFTANIATSSFVGSSPYGYGSYTPSYDNSFSRPRWSSYYVSDFVDKNQHDDVSAAFAPYCAYSRSGSRASRSLPYEKVGQAGQAPAPYYRQQSFLASPGSAYHGAERTNWVVLTGCPPNAWPLALRYFQQMVRSPVIETRRGVYLDELMVRVADQSGVADALGLNRMRNKDSGGVAQNPHDWGGSNQELPHVSSAAGVGNVGMTNDMSNVSNFAQFSSPYYRGAAGRSVGGSTSGGTIIGGGTSGVYFSHDFYGRTTSSALPVFAQYTPSYRRSRISCAVDAFLSWFFN
ncbi:unnamed protein product [Amoebophrya sp. A25]|nr:unnamed protein product [Amoebophrya sp. A25]|eukprot:GSA25T00016634001.1